MTTPGRGRGDGPEDFWARDHYAEFWQGASQQDSTQQVPPPRAPMRSPRTPANPLKSYYALRLKVGAAVLAVMVPLLIFHLLTDERGSNAEYEALAESFVEAAATADARSLAADRAVGQMCRASSAYARGMMGALQTAFVGSPGVARIDGDIDTEVVEKSGDTTIVEFSFSGSTAAGPRTWTGQVYIADEERMCVQRVQVQSR